MLRPHTWKHPKEMQIDFDPKKFFSEEFKVKIILI